MSRSPSWVRASTSSVGRHGRALSTHTQWYTIPSKTDSARILTAVQEHATALADALEAALPRWIERVASGVDPAPVMAAVMPTVRGLLAEDIDAQRTTPLAVVRDIAVPMVTAALVELGRPPLAETERDPFARERFPDDVYGLTPSSWADIDESLTEPGIAWGAAKAWVHRQRHGSA
jgi:hypothetical protein